METKRNKVCYGCNIDKPLSDYPPDHRAKDGKQTKCRLCINNWMRDHYRKHPAEHMIRRAKARAKSAGFEFNLTVDDILPLPEVCPVFGVPLRLSAEQQDPWAHSLDRIDNNKGYIKGNVAVMSYKANRLKNDGTAEEHEIIAAWIRKMLSANNDNTGLTRAAERVTIII